MNKIFFLIVPLLSILASCNWIWTKDVPGTGSTQTGYQNIEQTWTISPGPTEVRTIFIARGNEPFWSFEQTATGARFLRPGQEVVEETLYTSIETHSGTSILISATPVSTGSNIGVVLSPGVCSDGMSDIVYSYSVKLTLQNEVLNGCAQ